MLHIRVVLRSPQYELRMLRIQGCPPPWGCHVMCISLVPPVPNTTVPLTLVLILSVRIAYSKSLLVGDSEICTEGDMRKHYMGTGDMPISCCVVPVQVCHQRGRANTHYIYRETPQDAICYSEPFVIDTRHQTVWRSFDTADHLLEHLLLPV